MTTRSWSESLADYFGLEDNRLHTWILIFGHQTRIFRRNHFKKGIIFTYYPCYEDTMGNLPERYFHSLAYVFKVSRTGLIAVSASTVTCNSLF